ncbi:acyl-CoA dehydrogenase family protein [Amycolatopsis anabasis]|uniref:acyl-CoA dehydrogenase family protein n=1 Tax=Amycolatopsis anabasis TaxID=1840409 RepID=UPI00131BDD29|nr:acyl-CoA dehydrogenase family protein [Amycolatopsis anabasis]
MSPWNTPERLDLRWMVADFTVNEIAPNIARWEDDGEIPRDLHEKAGALGLLELGFPESAGGAGDLIDFLIVNEEMAHHGASSGLLVSLMSHSIAAPHIAAAGDPGQIERFVTPALAGTKIGSLAVTEPGGGSDVAALSTRAVRDGDHYVVNGAKTFITSGCRADFVTTAVRTGDHPHRGISLLVVEKGTPGFDVTGRLDKLGARCSDTAELSYVDVKVPMANLVGEEGSGFASLMRRFDSERLTLAVQSCGIAQRCLDLAIEWARQRVTFGRPLATRQVIRHKLAEMARQVSAARAFVHDVAARYTAGERVGAEIAMAKNTASFACNHVAAEAVQIFGGMGCMRESEVERHYRDARIMGIGGGSNEVMNEIIAKSLGLDEEVAV